MTIKQIKEMCEKEIEYHMNEFDLEREEVLDTAILNMIDRYMQGKLTKEDLIKCGNYLGFNLNMTEIDKRIEENRKRRERRLQKRLEKLQQQKEKQRLC
jgi:hypothetical protein